MVLKDCIDFLDSSSSMKITTKATLDRQFKNMITVVNNFEWYKKKISSAGTEIVRTDWEKARFELCVTKWLPYCQDKALVSNHLKDVKTTQTAKQTVVYASTEHLGHEVRIPIFMPLYTNKLLQKENHICMGGKTIVKSIYLWSDAHPSQIQTEKNTIIAMTLGHPSTSQTVLMQSENSDVYDYHKLTAEHVCDRSTGKVLMPNDPNNVMLTPTIQNNLRENHPYLFKFNPMGEYVAIRRLRRNTAKHASNGTDPLSMDPFGDTHILFVIAMEGGQTASTNVTNTYVYLPNINQRAQVARKWLYAKCMYTPLIETSVLPKRTMEDTEFEELVRLAIDHEHAPFDYERRFDYGVALNYDGWHNPLINESIVTSMLNGLSDNALNSVICDMRHIRDSQHTTPDLRDRTLQEMVDFFKCLLYSPATKWYSDECAYINHINSKYKNSKHGAFDVMINPSMV